MIRNRIILLVEDNLDEVELALRAFEINEIVNEIVVANDGQEALDYLFAEGSHAARGPAAMPDSRAARSEAAEARWTRSTPAHPGGSANEPLTGGGPHFQ
jgi:CheY-like chemotaxis protein